jgi:hypothetical protein
MLQGGLRASKHVSEINECVNYDVSIVSSGDTA